MHVVNLSKLPLGILVCWLLGKFKSCVAYPWPGAFLQIKFHKDRRGIVMKMNTQGSKS